MAPKHNGRNAWSDLWNMDKADAREEQIEARALEMVGGDLSMGEARTAARYERDCEDGPGMLYADDDPDWA